MSSKRIEILQAIETKLATITTGAGYNNTVQKTSYGFIDLSRVQEFPVVSLISSEANYVPMTNTEYTAGSAISSTDGWDIGIIGYCQASKEEEHLTIAMENLVEDIIKAILLDHTLGLSYVENAYLKGIDTLIDVEGTTGSVVIMISVKYDFPKNAP